MTKRAKIELNCSEAFSEAVAQIAFNSKPRKSKSEVGKKALIDKYPQLANL
jgi:hypothetical protein